MAYHTTTIAFQKQNKAVSCERKSDYGGGKACEEHEAPPNSTSDRARKRAPAGSNDVRSLLLSGLVRCV